ncbi:MAG: CotH kinase family protein [Wenyingzhuangia sp.]|uniref:CotH kinase family protein n=1 Tax=Wenyingzhuangia sp. TaxID=1964193 RepID=UPI0032191BEA
MIKNTPLLITLLYSMFGLSQSSNPNIAAPTPSHLSENVIAVYSDQYPSIATNTNPNWSQATIMTEIDIAGNKAMKYENLNYQGIDYQTTDVSSMEYVHLDYYTADASEFQFFLIAGGENAYDIATIDGITNGEWVSIDIPLRFFADAGRDLSAAFQFKTEGNNTLYLDNLYFWKEPTPQQRTLTDSNLPIMVIKTDHGIQDDPKVPGTMKLIYNDDGNRNYLSDLDNEEALNYNGHIGIEFRGSSSQALEKKPYGFSTLKEDGIANNNVKLLGMPSENDWILNSLPFDPSMIRDYLSYSLASKMGNYAPRVKYVEVIVNEDYKGVYLLTEKIKIDSDRVDVKKISEEDNEYPEITGGYIVKADKITGSGDVAWRMPNYGGWETDFLHHKPSADEITNEQAIYIENVFNDLASQTNPANPSITNGYPSIIDIPSFVDFMIMAEISSNPDAYQFSTYFHKDKNGKLRAGPVWDYNLTYGNDLFDWGFDRSHFDTWQFSVGNQGAKFWKDLFEDETFQCYLAKRWFELTAENQILNYNTIVNHIDEYAALVSEAKDREQERWGTVSEQHENIENMKNWILQRINWINTNISAMDNCIDVVVPNLVISKINYHPLEDFNFSSKDLEFIEITNHSDQRVDLTGYYIRKPGISYQFPENNSIEANQKIYLCNNLEAFESYYEKTPFDEFTRSLSNNSYQIILSDAFGNTIDEVTYKDESPWPDSADGLGAYLELQNLNADNSLASNWIASSHTLSNQNTSIADKQILVYPNPTRGKLNIQIDNFDAESLEFTIFNPLGQVVRQYQWSSNEIQVDISNLSQGVYYYRIKNNKGLVVKNKIIKR